VPTTDNIPTLRLKKNEERRLLTGHSWVFSNEIHDSLQGMEPGLLVRVISWQGRFLGVGHLNPHSLISIRLLSRRQVNIDRDFLKSRLLAALARRRRFLPDAQVLRLVFSEGDFLPGLIVDYYASHVVLQTLTQGMSRLESTLLDVLQEVLRPASITVRNDAPARLLEDLPLEKGVARGRLPDDLRVDIHGLSLHVDLLNGQKTGLFLDQRENWLLVDRVAAAARVLDGCCYQGAWALHAARCGAREVVGVDVSAQALEGARLNAAQNGLVHCCRFERQDIFAFLADTEERFDLIILDPPAFVKTKARLVQGEQGYVNLNRRAMKLLPPEGLLISCSCSHHLSSERFRKVLVRAARAAGKQLRLLGMFTQARDHPILLGHPESEYLKCAFLQVLQPM